MILVELLDLLQAAALAGAAAILPVLVDAAGAATWAPLAVGGGA